MGKNRFLLTEPTPSADLSGPSINHLMELFQNDENRKRIRRIVYDALGLYLVIDPTSMKEFRIRMSQREPKDDQEEQAVDDRARTFHRNAKDIANTSDGVKAFTGIIASLFSSDFKTILIDEPEAFLHPPLARKLGLRITEIAQQKSANILMATHSSDFVMGCIESGNEINIARLTYRDGVSGINILNHEELTPLMQDPMLRSSGVISSLFHSKVIVTEADTDRAFYEEINLRMLEHEESGVEDCLFLNAQSKQTIRKIMAPLNRLGVSVAAIFDIDVVKDGGKDWTGLLKAAQVPATLHEHLNGLRQSIKKSLESTYKNMKTDGGMALLDDEDKKACLHFFSELAHYGIFVVPFGEVESWLSYLEIPRNKQGWLEKTFEKLASKPGSANYVTPYPDEDVWKFIAIIAEWFEQGKTTYDF